MTTFFASDAHFGHANIIKYCKRPWPTVDEMQEGLISRWNEKVAKTDEVFFLGDIAMGPKPEALVSIVERLHGKKHWVYGNHDSSKVKKAVGHLFASAGDLMETTVGDQLIIMCHYPMYRWNKAQFGSWMLHGHSHGQMKYPFEARICDVSLDAWDWYPITVEDIKPRMEFKPVVFETDRTEVR